MLSPIEQRYFWLYDKSIEARYTAPTLSHEAVDRAIEQLGHVRGYILGELERRRAQTPGS
jgi:hypothetical protein